MKNNRNLPPRPPVSLSPEKKKLIISLALVSIVSSVIYFEACYGITDPTLFMVPIVAPVVFWVAFACFFIAYLIYNRAFSRKNLTIDMLPGNWTAEQKESYISDGKRRMEKSKWMLYIIIPLFVPIALDALYLFTLPLIQNLFGITMK